MGNRQPVSTALCSVESGTKVHRRNVEISIEKFKEKNIQSHQGLTIEQYLVSGSFVSKHFHLNYYFYGDIATIFTMSILLCNILYKFRKTISAVDRLSPKFSVCKSMYMGVHHP